jgi:hypothetical protein
VSFDTIVNPCFFAPDDEIIRLYAAQALRPLAGDGASLLFALGIITVGFLAVPIMTMGAAYDLAQTNGMETRVECATRGGQEVLRHHRGIYDGAVSTILSASIR